MLIIRKHFSDTPEIAYTFTDIDGTDYGTLTESYALDDVPFWHGIIDTHVVMIDDDDDLVRQLQDHPFFLHEFALRHDDAYLIDDTGGYGTKQVII